MKIRLLLAVGGVLALAAGGTTAASAITATDGVTVKVVKGPGDKGGKGGTAGTGGKRETYGTQEATCDDGNTLVYSGPLEMWPPNHKYRDLTVTATDDEPQNTVTLTTTGTHDEYLQDGTEMNGSGNTDNDFLDVTPGGMDSGTGSAQTEHRIRGERSGRGDGRTYTINALATFSDGEECSGTFTSFVPHDQGKGNDSRRKRARR